MQGPAVSSAGVLPSPPEGPRPRAATPVLPWALQVGTSLATFRNVLLRHPVNEKSLEHPGR